MTTIIVITYSIIISIIVLIIDRNLYSKNRRIGEIHDALLSPEGLETHAKELGRNHVISRGRGFSNPIMPRLNENYKYITKTYKKLNKYVKNKKHTVSAAEWLLDNYYIIEQEVKEIKKSLSKKYYGQLPIIKEGILTGYPRVYAIALELVAHTDGRFDEKLLVNFIKAYQSQSLLSISELWAIALMIRIALIESIRHVCEKIIESQQHQLKAEAAADNIIDILQMDEEDDEKVIQIIDENIKGVKKISPSYAQYLFHRLKNEGSETAAILQYLDDRLNEQGTTAEEITALHHQQQAGIQVSISNAITSLRLIASLDWSSIFETLSKVEQILRKDPEGIYPEMDFESRDYYRHIVEKLSRKVGVAETQIARKAVFCARKTVGSDDEQTNKKIKHVGYYLIGKGRKELELSVGYKPSILVKLVRNVTKDSVGWYIGSIVFFTSVLTVLFMYYSYRYALDYKVLITIITGLVIFIPSSDIVIGIINWFITHFSSPMMFPKMELKEGIPDDAATMVVIPTLIPNEKRAKELVKRLEVFYLANREKNLYFSLLGDYKDSEKEVMPEDKNIIDSAISSIRQLNKKYSNNEGKDIFFFLHRYRQYNDKQNVWIGWERKRGALMEFNELLRGNLTNTSFSIIEGNIKKLPRIKYVITLDADTVLPINAARRLIGTMYHPLNKPVINENLKRVVQGYGLLQPRIGIDVVSANASLFSRIFAGQAGIDPYTTAVSDIYQDLFDEGIFTGKGIYDVDVFREMLKDRIPDNSVLSHDLLEGCYVRAGLVTDIELVDGYPAKYSSYAARLHRWVRGDWQLVPWLKKTVKDKSGNYEKNPLSTISKWKILDNLRRSLVAPSLILLLALGFSALPGNSLLWILSAVVCMSFKIITGVIDEILSKNILSYAKKTHSTIIWGFKAVVYQTALLIAFLPHEAYLMFDAVIRTLGRIKITKRNMLEWVTAADAEKRLKNDVRSYFKRMWSAPFIGTIIFILALKFKTQLWIGAFIFFTVWGIVPFIAYLISKEEKQKKYILTNEDMQVLRKITLRTWRYFQDFVTAKENYLPPDNYQEDPPKGIAHRTSPTNIGLMLMSVLAAADMGYIGICELIQRIDNSLETVEKMDKWKGHLYNWYNTHTLKVLRPVYVSTVDSGNFIGYLITLKYGLTEYMKKSVIRENSILGIKDAAILAKEENIQIDINILDSFINEVRNEQASIYKWNKILKNVMANIKQTSGSNNIWMRKLLDMLVSYKNEISNLMLWINSTCNIPKISEDEYSEVSKQIKQIISKLESSLSITEMHVVYEELISEISNTITALDGIENKVENHNDLLTWSNTLLENIKLAQKNVDGIYNEYKDVINRIQNIIDSTSFVDLYDGKRQLFSIGYNAEEEKLTETYYDLFASEARQASFIAIAKGEVAPKHWFQLGRNLTSVDGYKGLVSWTGTMFEYLMPLLIMKNYKNTLLDETYHFLIRSQKSYGQKRNVPWGISESAYYAFDINLNYQYKAFGVPELGFKRGLANDMVVAPYASVMALMVDAKDAVENIKQLTNEGLYGPYGFYEAVDYTPERQTGKDKKSIVKSFMIHHQGMSMMAFDNYINNGIMQERFHLSPMVKSAELLLQEKVPIKGMVTKQNMEKVEPLIYTQEEDTAVIKTFTTAHRSFPETHILSNGSYSTAITDSGCGYSKRKDNMVTRWRCDSLQKRYGLFFYIADIDLNRFWSATYAPYCVTPEKYKVIFSPHKIEFSRKDGDIDTNMEIVVSPEEDVEVRRISLTNHGETARIIEVTSYFEVVMASLAADIAHPAFCNLFMQTEFLQDSNSLIAARRPRKEDDEKLWTLHTIFIEGEAVGGVEFETDRSKFIGRGRNVSNPVAMEPGRPLSNTVGSVLDPIMSLRCRIKIEPGQTTHVSYITGLFESRTEAVEVSKKYKDIVAIERAFELALTRSKVESRYLSIEANKEMLFRHMISQILFLNPLRIRREDIIKSNTKGQPDLWSYGISGDIPIVLVSISNAEQIDIVQDMVKAHEYWRMKGLIVDLVILNENKGSYIQPIFDMIRNIVSVSHARDIINKFGGVFVLDSSTMPDEHRILLFTVAKIVLRGDGGTLSYQTNVGNKKGFLPKFKKWEKQPEQYPVSNIEVGDLLYNNGWGGFSATGKEYIVLLRDGNSTPAPWSNVIANEYFGTLVTESGGGYTWSENSRENKLTTWSNDPVTDPPAEVLYLRDEQTGEVWTPTPLPIRENEPYVIRHGFGYSVFEHVSHGIEQKVIEFVTQKRPVKLNIVKFKNISNVPRKIKITYYVRCVLGVSNEFTAPYIVTSIDEDMGILLAENKFNHEFPQRLAFVGTSEKIYSFTCDCTEFLGEAANMKLPEALRREELSGRLGAGYNPCIAVQTEIELDANEEKEMVFMLGQCANLNNAKVVYNQFKDLNNAKAELEAVKNYWNNTLGVVNINTPDMSMNLILNGWILYQNISCRIWSRSAFYQSGGAYGFRDQLQDVMAVVYALPQLTYNQIIKHASHQFVEGDVQHWWHSGSDKGIRTKFSDDLLWLPYVTADYIKNTGDYSILDVQAQYLTDEALKEEEDERYNIPCKSCEQSSIYVHCIRAIERGLRFGEHGIPLMGSGDWNDGMNTVGNKGKGESVWLGWFLFSILRSFIHLCEYKNDIERANKYKEISKEIVKNIEENAWDGGWYRRAYFDDGTPLGSAQNIECKIDSLAQSWSVISHGGAANRSRIAMEALEHYLIKKEEGLIMLLTPPFDKSELNPGYIKGYVPGVRENGGQYTHAAIWVVLAFSKMGEGDKAWKLYNMINPVNHSRTPIEAAKYKVEPYVMAADVYAVEPHVGRGGWTWYTGSAGWMYRVGIEHIIGFKKKGDILKIDPCIPKNWSQYSIEYKYEDTLYVIDVKNPEGVNERVKSIKIDGNINRDKYIKLINDKKNHVVEVILG